MDAARLVSSAIALAGTLSQLAVIAATIPRWSECANGMCSISEPDMWVEVNIWRPFIDNVGDGELDRREPRCPVPTGRAERHGLAAAPLPDGFDPDSHGDRPLYACVLVARDGEVLAARMLRGTGHRTRDLSLVGTIRASWRFEPDHEAPRPSSWQRVKLSSGPGFASIYQPPELE